MIDVAIGLVFLFFALASVCSFLQERIASVFSLRQRILYRALQGMLEESEDPLAKNLGFLRRTLSDLWSAAKRLWKGKATGAVDVLMRDPMVRALRGRGWFGELLRPAPSYLPREFFVQAARRMGADLATGLSEDAYLIINQSTDRQIGDWFDATMERAQGFYKRMTQVSLLVVATVIVVGFNIDTIQISNTLFHNAAAREIVAMQAQKVASSERGTEGGVLMMKELIKEGGLSLGIVPRACEEHEGVLSCAWKGFWTHLNTANEHALGWLLSILAAALGAPFWFDLLSRITSLRASGQPEGSAITPDRSRKVPAASKGRPDGNDGDAKGGKKDA